MGKGKKFGASCALTFRSTILVTRIPSCPIDRLAGPNTLRLLYVHPIRSPSLCIVLFFSLSSLPPSLFPVSRGPLCARALSRIRLRESRVTRLARAMFRAAFRFRVDGETGGAFWDGRVEFGRDGNWGMERRTQDTGYCYKATVSVDLQAQIICANRHR